MIGSCVNVTGMVVEFCPATRFLADGTAFMNMVSRHGEARHETEVYALEGNKGNELADSDREGVSGAQAAPDPTRTRVCNLDRDAVSSFQCRDSPWRRGKHRQ